MTRGRESASCGRTPLPAESAPTRSSYWKRRAPRSERPSTSAIEHKRHGGGHTKLKLIVQEAFSSTLVNGSRQRVDLNRIGVWFADPLADDFCLGAGSPVTPFDGDNAAGVQAFNSANADPLPAP